ncbi:MAG: phytase [candidate division KSB1 bacterium]|nr:phytase [candidate division KSB1 bacterium]MDZ7302095.1 phytase [candidate division KSB1 bacterium]MDZ7311136.1 phytase [candidate division KSB1 bacterium]
MSFRRNCFRLVLSITEQLLKTLIITLTAAGLMVVAATKTCAQNIPATISVTPKVSTSAVKDDADDPAIWIHPTDPAKSVVIGTDKGTSGGLYVWDLNGKQLQYVPLGRPNNVDVRYGMKVGGQRMDIAVTNLRSTKEMKVFKIDPSNGTLIDITTSGGIPTPELDDPYGICLYQRQSDGAMFAIQSTQTGATSNLHQWRLEDDGKGRVKGTYVRTFGNNSIKDYVEGLVADDELGYVYASDEPNAVRKYYADPDRGNNDQIVAFATGDGISGDREGLAIYKCAGGTGYLLVSSQGNTTVKVYRREGEVGNPHKHTLVTTIKTNGSSNTDGLDVTNRPTSEKFPKGFLVTHNSSGNQFNLYPWEMIAQTFLTICPGTPPSAVQAESNNALPEEFGLEQNYPNPLRASAFNPSTVIPFHLNKSIHVKLTIVNIMGQAIRTLVEGQMPAGEHLLNWDGRSDAGEVVPSGTYFICMEKGNTVQVKPLLLVK